ncbi:unnamed protein product [Rotaria sp. Silwood1]|nr:unnamed protein product [Rotaria sp. Silwood1]CAF1470494.1 unnamed protein product [Rotaria sp. Silwood1]CAF3528253.1 unnamed protein product [Rotaria sp. Silwood1]CAF3643232.1 unnamed protein product [Rotaria sp. Silwood1]CAF3689527.1 unnamed protein product [Rotaria sp. Silwood1]
MEESIYRMSLSESFLVLIIIGLWLFAIINLARKLERICNPPSILPNYYTRNRTSLNPSTLHEHYPPNPTQSTDPSAIHIFRATSEPTIDASPRTTIHMHYPSETCLLKKSSISEQIFIPDTIELETSNSSLNISRYKDHRINVEIKSNHPKSSQPYLNPKRIPPIVRRSLLDLHRRALFSNISSNISMNHYIVNAKENRTGLTTIKTALIKKKYQHENTIDEDDCYKSKIYFEL